MHNWRRQGSWGVVVVFIASMLLLGCASVPKEVVGLSYQLGGDIGQTHDSYVKLIRQYFASLRQNTDDFLTNRWQPVYLSHFIEDGGLVGLATEPDPNQVLEGVQVWAEVALEEIQAKRHELLDPLDRQEAELLSAVDEAFGRMLTANATITGHLNSIRRVDELQSDALKKLGLGNLRDRIDQGIERASKLAEEGIQKTIEADHLVERGQEIRDRIGR